MVVVQVECEESSDVAWNGVSAFSGPLRGYETRAVGVRVGYPILQ